MYQVDLSRFEACTIKKPKLCDLMRLKEFRAHVDAYHGQITDQWVLATTKQVEQELRTSEQLAKHILDAYGVEALRKRKRKHHYCKKAVLYLERSVNDNGREGNSELS